MKSFNFKQSHPNKVELDSGPYFKNGNTMKHVDDIIRCFNSIVFVCSMAFLSNNDRSKIDIVSQISMKYGYL